MKILLLGKSGQVGFELKRALSPFGDIVAPNRYELDLAKLDAVNDFVNKTKPDVIVNAAAWTDVDGAEVNKNSALRLNTILPTLLATYAKEKQCKLVHYSSDYVYPGTGTQAWSEESQTNPINYYGVTKLDGDQAIEDSETDYLIFRTSWVYSARRNNFMKTMLRLAESKRELGIIDDQIGSPTTARLIAQTTVLALHSNLKAGVYNLAAKGYISWHKFAESIFSKAKLFDFDSALEKVNAIPTQDYPTPAKRPLNSRMNVSKLESALNITMPSWEDELADTLEEYLEKK
ncbi:dTDP-4-dehydrorhamnose reductase [Idiomarina abyssalis]|uniref:dTDP-4-dehydrorhamnose reductase n=1 Tax=Idiomarina abyssalis TaxID=86102 RepID=A0A8I1GA04_9GAMM|nr:dTDP-4-dehydrorhamnose reductase [Idiomarina abyssalis]MBJ7265749.1 dTDP-4-dehydrorhamnose reductase [Idiomarina abyssalis]MBJ7274002.1 dTDP-4-dehydrorhamnose reductase [Idiomarina abyssalis]MBJ7314892.1 dTDP-4-dehydrorhamnose reductase [Idiomarina abyssalis]